MPIQMRRLGRTDIMVSNICLGTMTWGEQNTEDEGHAQIDMARDHGVNFLDTAELYAIPPKPETQGRTEEIIGTWLAARKGRREDVVIATKIVGRTNDTWYRDASVEQCRLNKAQIDEAVLKSLKRLQTDYIDLYQLHWPDRPAPLFGQKVKASAYAVPYEPFEAILEALAAHVDAGRIRAIGVSNETPYGVMRFLAESNAQSLPRMASIQNAYNLVNRTFEEGLEEVALREHVGLLAYSPLAQGYLSGKYRGGAMPPRSRKALFDRMQRYEKPRGQEAINAYLDLAAERGMTPQALALKFVDTRPFTTSTIIGATTPDQLQADLDAFDTDWTDELESAVEAIHSRNPSPCP